MMVYHDRDERVDEYHCPMKDARKLKDIEDFDYDEEIKEDITVPIKIQNEKCKGCRKSKEIPCFNEESHKCWFELEQEIKPREPLFLTPEEISAIPIHTEAENKAEKLSNVIKSYDKWINKLLKNSIIPEGAPKQKDTSKTTIAGATGPSENNPGTDLLKTGACGATIYFDVEALSRRMPGRNVGYTKNGIKPKCPVCHVTITEFGMCPVCLRTVTKRFNANGNPVPIFNDKGPVYDRYKKPEIINIYVKRKTGDKIIKEYVAVREFNNEWLRNEEISKFNFSGTVNKKSDGRSPRGEIPDAKDPERMTKFRHTPSFKLDFQVKTIEDEGKPRYAFNDIPVRRVKLELKECPICGCKVVLKELRRNDKLCPKCGLRYGENIIHLDVELNDVDGD